MKTYQPEKFFFGIIVLMLFSLQTYAQDNWTLLKEESGIQVYYQPVDCATQFDVVDPLDLMAAAENRHELLKLKVINSNTSSKSITFSKVTKTDDSDELITVSVSTGTTLFETCEASPKMSLTKQNGDKYPVSFTDFLNEFTLTIEN
jgi:hypothetical protein